MFNKSKKDDTKAQDDSKQTPATPEIKPETKEEIKSEENTDTGNNNPASSGLTEREQELLNEIEKLKKDLHEMTELGKRAIADMQNQSRRLKEEKIQILFMANADLIKAVLPSINSLKRALVHKPEGQNPWVEGLEMSINQITKILESAGLKEINALNQHFDPNLHEAVMEGEGPKDTVIEVLENGYTYNDIVIMHSKVKVGTEPHVLPNEMPNESVLPNGSEATGAI